MARAGDELANPVSGERIVFLQTATDTGGDLLEMDDFWTQPGHRTPEHVHPQMQERWEILAGRVCFCIGGVERTVGPGEAIVAEPGVAHTARKLGPEPVHLRIQMRPALRWELFVEQMFTLAREALDDAPETPSGNAMVDLLREFPREIATFRPPMTS
jgi:quercetin dioxygenase-like cupin family protein